MTKVRKGHAPEEQKARPRPPPLPKPPTEPYPGEEKKETHPRRPNEREEIGAMAVRLRNKRKEGTPLRSPLKEFDNWSERQFTKNYELAKSKSDRRDGDVDWFAALEAVNLESRSRDWMEPAHLEVWQALRFAEIYPIVIKTRSGGAVAMGFPLEEPM